MTVRALQLARGRSLLLARRIDGKSHMSTKANTAASSSRIRHQPAFLLLDRRAQQVANVAIGADPDLLLNTKQLAEWLGVSTQWVEIGRSKGYGPPFRKIGLKAVRYHVGDVKAWLEARSHHSTAAYCKPEA